MVSGALLRRCYPAIHGHCAVSAETDSLLRSYRKSGKNLQLGAEIRVEYILGKTAVAANREFSVK